MNEYLVRYRNYAAEDDIAAAFAMTGFQTPGDIAKQLLKAHFNPNEGYIPAYIAAHAIQQIVKLVSYGVEHS